MLQVLCNNFGAFKTYFFFNIVVVRKSDNYKEIKTKKTCAIYLTSTKDEALRLRAITFAIITLQEQNLIRNNREKLNFAIAIRNMKKLIVQQNLF